MLEYKVSPRGGLSAMEILRQVVACRAALLATTRLEIRKRYSGAVLGWAWAVLYPAVFLGIYLFVFLVLFGVRFPGFGDIDYVLYVFCGLVPYLAFMDAVSTSARSIRQNVQLIRNVILPIELVPLRCVAVAMVGQAVGLVLILGLSGAAGAASVDWAWLPAVLVLQCLLFAGVALFVAALSAALPDLEHAIQLVLLLLLFVSPIAFTPDRVPEQVQFVIYLNPIHYMAETFRGSLVAGHVTDAHVPFVFAAISVLAFVGGSAVFMRFRALLSDYV